MFGVDLSSTHMLVKPNLQKIRKSLPSEMVDRSKISIWSILKQCVDKELYRFTIPIIWNEPLSLIQVSKNTLLNIKSTLIIKLSFLSVWPRI